MLIEVGHRLIEFWNILWIEGHEANVPYLYIDKLY